MNFTSLVPFVLQTIMWFVAKPILWFFGRLSVRGLENIQDVEEGAIFAINHVSDIDPILLPSSLGPLSPFMPIFSVALESTLYQRPWPRNFFYGGKLFSMLGAYPVSIGTKEDYEHILKKHIRILESGESVGIFPEGGRNVNGEIAPARAGVAYLLWRTGRPVIPVAISGHYHITPLSFFARKHKITVSYGKPIMREDIFKNFTHEKTPSRDEFRNAAQVIMAHVREAREQM